MCASLKVGDRCFDSDQIISALVQYKLLETLVEQVILDEVIQAIDLSKAELFYSLTGATENQIPEDLNHFLTHWCQEHGVTFAYFESVLLRDLKIEKLKQTQFATQVESVFLAAKSTFDQIEYSLIQLTDATLATELYFQIRDDAADLARLAQIYSLGNERQTGGWLGPVPLATLPIEVAAAVRQAKAGVVCEPIAVGDRIWLVRLERLISARLTEATRLQIINQLYRQWLQTRAKSLIATPGAIEVLTAADSIAADLEAADSQAAKQ